MRAYLLQARYFFSCFHSGRALFIATGTAVIHAFSLWWAVAFSKEKSCTATFMT